MSDRPSQRLPLTGAQAGVWYGQRLDPSSPVYNVGQYVEIEGPLDPGVFVTALRRTVSESEALTARFSEDSEGVPYQETWPGPASGPLVAVLDHTGSDDPVTAALDAMRRDIARPLDLAADTPCLFALHRVGPGRVLWYQRAHHIVLDAFGFSLVSRRTAEVYSALVRGEEPPARPFGALASVVEAEREYLASEACAADRAYWLERLADCPEPEALSGAAVPAAHGFLRNGAALSPEETTGLLDIARAARASWADVVTAAFAAFVHRSTGGRDVLLSVPAMARLGSAALKVPAMVVNVLPLRVAVRPGTPFGELVGEVAAAVTGLRRHQRYRAEDIRRDLGLSGRARGLLGPMVNVKAFDTALDFAGSPGSVHNIAAGPVDDVTLGVYHDSARGRIRFEFDGNPDAYDAAALAERCAEFAHFLRELAAAGPEAPVGRPDLLAAAELERAVRADDGTARALPPGTYLDLFAEAARLHPGRDAVIAGKTSLDYTALDERSDRLARVLAACGAGPEAVVGIALPRGRDLVVALLGVLKSGAAYLPLDLDYPADRLSFMVEDARPVCVLTTLDLAHLVPQVTDVPVVVLDSPDTLSALADADRPVTGDGSGSGSTDADAAETFPRPAPHHPAYVIYTSGSTGRPKGVVVPHSALANFLRMQSEVLALAPGDRLVAVTTVSFDIHVLEIHTPLLCGATVVLADRDAVRDPAALAALVDEHRPAVMQATPSLWHALLEDGRPTALSGTRVLVGGEALPAGLAERLARTARSVTNVYGPTEATVWATSTVLSPDHTGVPDIGTPFWNTRARVLDGALRPVAPGRPGELYLGGAQLARGYLGRPALTSERFVADPYGVPGERMYRTGDLVRRLADGRIEFLGRADDQIKLRGFRIELGEVEAVLSDRAGVGRAVCLVREDLPGFPALIGYVTPATAGGAPAPDAGELRRALAKALPEYMVPSAVVVLDAFPLTANGKVDRRALPAPDLSGLASAGGRGPRGAREEILAGIFADVLGVPAVGAEDDFFALGGHSLLAARVIARTRAALGTDCGIRDVFEARTVAALAALLSDRAAVSRTAPSAGPRPDPLPLSYAQQRLWFLHQMEGPSATYNIPFAVRFADRLDAPALDAALADTVARHEALRTLFGEADGVPFQRVLAPAEARVRLAVDEVVGATAVDTAVTRALGHLFDLAAEPPLRVTLVRDTEGGTDALVVLLHHIASDEWSMGPFLRDLERAYAARVDGAEAAFAPLPVQYADYALWQRELLGAADRPGTLAATQAAFWRSELAALPEEAGGLPADRPRPVTARHAGALVYRQAPRELALAVRSLARESGTSVFMVVHAAVAAVLHRLGAGEDLVLGSPVAGRADSALDELVGFFVNTVVLRTDLSGDPTFGELLGRVRAADLSALDHADLPFDQVVEAVNPERSLSRHPLFQTMVSHSTVSQDVRTVFGLPARADRVDPGVTKFDLDITFADSAHAEDLELEVFYATALFDAQTVETFADRLLRALAEAVAAPARRVSAWELRDAGERERLARWNDTDRAVPGQSVVRVFAEQVAATPDAVAVVAGEVELTFAELAGRAGRLAAVLRAEGVGADSVVALAVPRSADAVVAILAVLKAGAAYLPLDLDHPAERLAHMLRDADPVCVVTTLAVSERVPGVRAVVLDDPATAARLASAVPGPDATPHPEHTAYVIYTSGSTGRPKGVLLRHAGLTLLFRDHERELYLPVARRLGRRVRALHTASFSFDSSWEQLLWLIAGHELHVLDEFGRRDAEAVVAYVRARRIDTLDVTPSYARQLLDAGLLAGEHRPPLFLLGGEAVPAALWQELAALTDVEVVNYYGPTEFTVDALVARVGDCPSPVVGRPLDNTRAHVLDGRLGPVPTGVTGELYLAGEQIARGYLGRFALTAERFVADPFGAPGSRMYRTGDLVRRRGDGLIEFLGRADDQVKIRGFRVELGEVEAALTALEGVSAAAVVVREDTPGIPRLVGYVTGVDPRALERLRGELAAHLPEHMVPAALVSLDALPTNVNGKLDRALLPAPVLSSATSSRPPRGAAEERIAEVFAQALSLLSVGAEDDFFRLGGHSLLATRVAARIRAAGTECSVRDVFEARTVARLAARLADRGRAAHRAPVGGARPERLPLSYAQARLWFLHRMDGPSATYNIPLALRLRGALDPAALEAAVRDVVARHEALRTVFAEDARGPYQRIRPAAGIEVPFVVERVPAAGHAARIERETARPFDLTAELPLRATLLEAGEPGRAQEWTLLLLMHHIAGDEWSTGPLLTDLAVAYAARLGGRAPLFEALPVQYADYALWQRGLLGDPSDEDSPAHRQTRYWREALSGLPEELALPADRPRPAAPTHTGRTVTTELPAGLVSGLDALASASGTTAFAVVSAAVAALLHRLGAGEDIPLGSPVAGRGEESLDPLVGFFVNTVVLRADLSGTPSFRELLRRTARAATQALDHADLPFEAVVEAVNPERSLSRHPLFQTMVAYEGAARGAVTLFEGLVAEEAPVAAGAAKFDLEVLFRRTAAADSTAMTCGIRYATDLFDEETARTLADRLVRLLDAAVAEPDRQLAELDVLSPEERDLVLHTWNDTAAEHTGPTTLAALVTAGAAGATGPALVFEATELDRPAFEERVNRLARLLIDHGVGPETVVAVALPRSFDLTIALHAVIRAGGAYLPLDLELPAERLAYMTATAAPALILTDSLSTTSLPPEPDGTERIVLDAPETRERLAVRRPGEIGDAERLAPLLPHHPAYVIFTSGSTGRPKGVMVEHQAITNRLAWMQHTYQLTHSDRVLQKTPAGFDVSVWEFFWPLAQGVPLVIARPDGHKDPDYLADLIREQHVTVLHFVPSVLAAFLDAADPADCPSLRLVVCSGEALPTELVTRFHTPATQIRLANLYGPTEAAVDVTAAFCTPEPGRAARPSAPIGSPVWNTQVYVLDARLRPVPPGVPGELYLAGVQLARGYLSRPALTAERFTANPYGPPGTRMYRTGDLARWLPDGRLDYLGRTDDQIKLRGLRIELGEISAVLTSAPAVGQATVLVREDLPGSRQLVAYVVPAPGASVDTDALRALAAARLPAYMVPAVVLILDRLPLSPNGKLDRRALPAPELGDPSPSRGPRNLREEILAGILADVLGRPAVGMLDDFFALGGHSLLAARVAGRIREVLGVECGIRDVFELRTVEALAARLAERTAGTRPRPAAGPRPERPPLSFAQRRLWLLDSVRGPSATYNVPVAVRLHGPVDFPALRAAAHDLVARHEVLRTVVAEHEGEPYQYVLPLAGASVPVELREVAGDRFEEEATLAGGHVFDLAAELPLRVTLLRAAPDDHVLVLLVHHIATDESSTGLLLADLDTAYAARLSGTAPEFPALPAQYADFASRQRELLGDAADPESPAARQAGFWRTALADIPAEVALPTDRTRPAQPSYEGGVVGFSVSEATATALLRLARERGATAFMAAHAAVAGLLHRLGAGEDIPLGSPVSARDGEEWEGLAGFFLNTLVLRADLSGAPTFGELVTRVRDTSLAAFAHADLPWEAVVEAADHERSRARNPLFQTMVTYHSVDSAVPELFGLPSGELTVETGGAKFDLEVAFGTAREGAGIEGGIRYATDLFDEETARTLADRLVRLLDAAVAEPDRPLAELDVLSSEERDLVLHTWNDTTAEHTGPTTLAALVTAGAAGATGPALVFEATELDRPAFEERVNRLARLLIDHGVGPETVVAVALPRSFDLIIALHAVIRAGGAYLPLDLELPAERLAYMTETAAPVCLVTDLASLGAVPLPAEADIVVMGAPEIEADLARVSSGPLSDADRAAPLLPHHPAYVIFTSGSTGRPKGVMVEHQAITNRLAWMQHTYQLTHSDRVLQKTPAGFDVSVWEFFWPLAQGVPLVIARPDGHKDPDYLADLIREQHVTVLHFVPSMLAAFLGEAAVADCPSLRLVVCSGEALPAELVTRFHAPAAHIQLANLYGPTEAAVDVTAFTCTPATGAEGRPSAPIGSPVWNTQVYVLDARLRPVPPGVPGELYLAGVQLARGYLSRPGLTAERFTANPYGPPGTRMYRTGDLARWLPDGRLDYLGRTDDQIKLRGLRIELGEIEAVFASVDEVERAVVLVREDVPGVQRLVAYVVPATGANIDIDTDALRASAAARLPAYMVPAVVLILEELPLSPNGKLDRRALPAPVPPPRPVAAQVAAPEPSGPAGSPAEVLAALMAEVLGLPAMAAEENFFELGGDSIISIRLVGMARKAGLKVSARQIFQHPTPAGLAGVVTPVADGPAPAARPSDAGPGPLPLPPVAQWLAARGGPFASFGQARLIRLPAGAVHAQLVTALQCVLDHHDGLRQALTVPRPGVWSAVVRPAGSVRAATVLERVEAAGLQAAGLRELIAGASARLSGTLDPEAGVMVRAVHVDRGPNEPGRLLVAAHHLVVDEVSWQILLPDLRSAYEQAAEGRVPVLEPVGTSLRTWTTHLLAEAQHPRRTAELDRWLGAAAGGPLLAGRPLDPARDTAATARALAVRLSAERTAPLLQAVPSAFHGTVGDTLLTALSLAVGEWAARQGRPGGRAFTVDLEGHGREQELLPGADLTRTVGWLTSIYPLRLAASSYDPAAVMDGREDAGAALKEVKELLRAVPDGGLGAGLLRYANPATAALFAPAGGAEILWNYLGRQTGREAAAWGPAEEADALAGRPHPDLPLSHALEVNVEIADGPDGPELAAVFVRAGEALPEETVALIADRWLAALDALAAWARGTTTGGHTPSDLDLVELDQDQIDMLEEMWRAQQ
ncbi:Tyrocidine synthase 3 [Streptomyces avidinii]